VAAATRKRRAAPTTRHVSGILSHTSIMPSIGGGGGGQEKTVVTDRFGQTAYLCKANSGPRVLF